MVFPDYWNTPPRFSYRAHTAAARHQHSCCIGPTGDKLRTKSNSFQITSKTVALTKTRLSSDMLC